MGWWWTRLLIRGRRSLRRRQLDRELDEELRFHREMAAEEARAAGLEADAARREAERRFGNATRIRETSRELFLFTAVENLWRDLRHRARSLQRNPVIVAVAVLSLGLGIGATTTVYSLVDALLLHDVTARQPERLVALSQGLSYLNYRDLRGRGVFADLAAFRTTGLDWRDGDRLTGVVAHLVTANVFELLGVQAERGRVFTEKEAAAERDPRVVVVGYRFWQQRLQGDPAVIGRVLRLNHTPFTVIGVLPPHYRSIQGLGMTPDVYVPLSTAVVPGLFRRTISLLLPVGRLSPRHTREGTQAALFASLRDLERRYPSENRNLGRPTSLTPIAGFERSVFGRTVVTFATALAAVVLCLLLLACANVAGLLLARGAARQREMAVRLAIGAGRWPLLRQLLVESLLLAVGGVGTGVVLAFWSASALSRVELPLNFPFHFDYAPDLRLVAVSAGLCLLATVLSGLAPAWQSTRPHVSAALQQAQTPTLSRIRLRSTLVVTQIGLAVLLLSGAAIFTRSLVRMLTAEPGFDLAHTATLEVHPDADLSLPTREALQDDIYRSLTNAPEVEAVSWAEHVPFHWEFWEPKLQPADREPVRVTGVAVGPGYLRAMNIPLLAGRDLSPHDVFTARTNAAMASETGIPATVNQEFVRRYFADRNPLGQRLRWVEIEQKPYYFTVVGVTRDAQFRYPGEAPVPLLYALSYDCLNFVVRVAGPAETAQAALTRVVTHGHGPVGVGFVAMSEHVRIGAWPTRCSAVLLTVLAAIGLVLTLVGLCGVVIYNVTRRTGEIGIRLALGATTGRVWGMIVWDGLRLVIVGVVFGVALAWVAVRPLGQLLVSNLSATDPVAFAATALFLVGVSAACILLSSRRATQIDPMTALRRE